MPAVAVRAREERRVVDRSESEPLVEREIAMLTANVEHPKDLSRAAAARIRTAVIGLVLLVWAVSRFSWAAPMREFFGVFGW
jgi:hypothetical protein